MSSPFRCGRLARAPCERTEATWIVECSSGTVQCSAGVSRSAGPSTRWVFKRREGRAPARVPGYGPLVAKGELALPRGFNYQVISRQGQPMRDGRPTPSCFDGMGAFRGPPRHDRPDSQSREPDRAKPRRVGRESRRRAARRGVRRRPSVHRRMHEARGRSPSRRQPTGSLDDFAILGGTDNNCAGGVLPFRSWLTCEEVVSAAPSRGKKHGYIFEVDAHRRAAAACRADHRCRAASRTKRPCGAAESCTRRRIAASSWRPTAPRRRAARASIAYVPDRARFAGPGELAQGSRCRCRREAEARVERQHGRGRAVGGRTGSSGSRSTSPITTMTPTTATIGPGTPTRFQAQAKGAAVFDRMEGMWVGAGGRRDLLRLHRRAARSTSARCGNTPRPRDADAGLRIDQCRHARRPRQRRRRARRPATSSCARTRAAAVHPRPHARRRDLRFRPGAQQQHGVCRRLLRSRRQTLYVNQYGERGRCRSDLPATARRAGRRRDLRHLRPVRQTEGSRARSLSAVKWGRRSFNEDGLLADNKTVLNR